MRASTYTRGIHVSSLTEQYRILNQNKGNVGSPPSDADEGNNNQEEGVTPRGLSLNRYRRYHSSTASVNCPQSGCNKNAWETANWDEFSLKISKKKKKKIFFLLSVVNYLNSLMCESKIFNHKLVRNNKKEFVGWIMLVLLIIVGYKFFSDGSFSAILTLASTLQCFSLMLLNLKVISQQTVIGVSQRTVGLIITCLLFRLTSTLFFNGYLPVDRSGDWLYQGADITSVLLGIYLLIYAHRHCKINEQKDKDTCAVLIPTGIAAIVAMFIHPNLNQNRIADFSWTFALYLETFSMVPQLFMMGKLGGEVEALTSHYVASMAASKFFTILFWAFSFNELAPRSMNGKNVAGWAVIFSYTIQVLLFADFFYYYVKSIRIGRKMIINF